MPQPCLHNGNWSAASGRCENCARGWVGNYCGTAVSEDLALGFVAAVAVLVTVLLTAIIVIVLRCGWRPIVARGPVSMAVGLLGGAIWCYTATVPCANELLWLEPGGAGGRVADAEQHALKFFWLSLVPGFAIWLACNLIYLRTMVTVHIFSRIPLIFPLQLVVMLAPWVVVTHFQSLRGLVGVGGIFLLYACSLAWQLCKIWRDLLDVLPNLTSCVLGLATTSAAGIFAERQSSDTGAAKLAYAHPSAVVLLVALHFLATAAPVLLHALRGQCCCCCLQHDHEAEKRFYDEYTPSHLRSFASPTGAVSAEYADDEAYPYPSNLDAAPLRETAPARQGRAVALAEADNAGADAAAAARRKLERRAQRAAQDKMDRLVAERRQLYGDQSVIGAVAGAVKPVNKVVAAARKSGEWLSNTAAGKRVGGTFRGTFGSEAGARAGGIIDAIARYSFDRGTYGARQKGVTVRRGNGVQPYEISPHGRLAPLEAGGSNNNRKDWRSAQKQRVEQFSEKRGRGHPGGATPATEDERRRAAVLLQEQHKGPRSSEALKDLARFRMGGRSRPRAGAYDDVTVVRVGAKADGTGGELVAAVETNGSVDVLTGRDTGGRTSQHTTISGAPVRQNLDWGAGSMQHDLKTMSLQQPQRRPPAGGRVVPDLRAEPRQKLSGAPAEPPPTYGRKRTGP
eukprot:COSAG02_NODE_3959_length_5983_cov_9.304176_10_plen_682_part_00